MGTQTEIEALVKTIAGMIGAKHEEVGEATAFVKSDQELDSPESMRKLFIQRTELGQLLEVVSSMKSENGVHLYCPFSFEVPVFIHRATERFDQPLPPILFDRCDPHNGLTYVIGRPSKPYIVHFLRRDVDPMDLHSALLYESWEGPWGARENAERADLLQLLGALSAFHTLRISYQPGQIDSLGLSLDEFEALAASLFFQLSFNLDFSFTEPRCFQDLLPAFLSAELRSVKNEEIQPPERLRIPQLVYYYEAAISSNNPAAQFLSFYRVIEHFFDEVFERHSINAVRDLLTRAAFSHHRDRDISQLIQLAVKNRKVLPTGAVTSSEREALVLSLRDYVKLENLVFALQRYRGAVVDYYKTKNVPFTEGDTRLNLEHKDGDQVRRQLANRIYSTRNAVVHSKGGSEGKFIPFRHDQDLKLELPLIRVVAEEIIENSASLVNYARKR